MFSYKSRYCVAAAMAAMAALTGHVEARDIDLQSIGYFQFSPLPPSLVSQTDTLLLSDSPEYVGPVGGTLSGFTSQDCYRLRKPNGLSNFSTCHETIKICSYT